MRCRNRSLEFIGLPAAGKSTLVTEVIQELQNSGVRPLQRGEFLPTRRQILVTLVFYPFMTVRILVIIILVSLVANGTLAQRLRRSAKILRGLFKLVCALRLDTKLIIDEGPLVWMAALETDRERLREFVLNLMMKVYKVTNCAVVCITIHPEVLHKHQRQRDKERGSCDASYSHFSSISKQDNSGRELTLMQVRALLDAKSVAVLDIISEQQRNHIEVMRFSGWASS